MSDSIQPIGNYYEVDPIVPPQLPPPAEPAQTQIPIQIQQNPQVPLQLQNPLTFPFQLTGLPVAPYMPLVPEAVRNTRAINTNLAYEETGLFGGTDYEVEVVEPIHFNAEDNQGSPNRDNENNPPKKKRKPKKKLRMTI